MGGASTHSSKSGVAHFSCANEIALIEDLKALLLTYLKTVKKKHLHPYTISNEHRKNLNNIIPENPNQPYDIKEVIDEITDIVLF